jgi:hypothetical protein
MSWTDKRAYTAFRPIDQGSGRDLVRTWRTARANYLLPALIEDGRSKWHCRRAYRWAAVTGRAGFLQDLSLSDLNRSAKATLGRKTSVAERGLSLTDCPDGKFENLEVDVAGDMSTFEWDFIATSANRQKVGTARLRSPAIRWREGSSRIRVCAE